MSAEPQLLVQSPREPSHEPSAPAWTSPSKCGVPLPNRQGSLQWGGPSGPWASPWLCDGGFLGPSPAFQGLGGAGWDAALSSGLCLTPHMACDLWALALPPPQAAGADSPGLNLS